MNVIASGIPGEGRIFARPFFWRLITRAGGLFETFGGAISVTTGAIP